MMRFTQNPTEPGFVQNPYPFYARLRASGDLAQWDAYGLCATSHRAVNMLLRDRRFGREVPPEMARPVPAHLASFYAIEAHSMLELEPPRHTRLRGLVTRAFTSRRVLAMADEIEALSHGLIDAFPAGGCDLLRAFCQPLPVAVICRLLGVPEAQAPQLLAWSNAMVAQYQARRDRAIEEAASQAARDFGAYLADYIAFRRRHPADDLLTELIAAEERGDKLSTPELISTVILLLNAGHEATVHSLGNGIKALVQSGTRVDAETAAGAVEEILRFDPPLHLFTRYAYEDAALFGHGFQRGDQVALLLASAGRDASVWPEPDLFDITRPVQAHAGFGAGIHFCVGAPLARLEMQIALRVLFDRLPGLALAEAPRYANLYHFHGLESLQATYR